MAIEYVPLRNVARVNASVKEWRQVLRPDTAGDDSGVPRYFGHRVRQGAHFAVGLVQR